VNFNHFFDKKHLLAMGRCPGACYMLPTNDIRATSGNNISVTFYCKLCGNREVVFMTREQYNIHKSLLNKVVGDV